MNEEYFPECRTCEGNIRAWQGDFSLCLKCNICPFRSKESLESYHEFQMRRASKTEEMQVDHVK